MADKHPYSPGPGGIAAAINQLRKSFPKTVDSDTLKKLSIAPKNESYIINILRFIGAIDTSGNRTEEAAAVFTKSDEEFKQAFEKIIRTAYAGLFDLHKEAAWTLPSSKLVSYFRSTDQTTDLVGRLQASTFQLLARFAGHEQTATAAARPKLVKPKSFKPRKPKQNGAAQLLKSGDQEGSRDFGLTVRIEVNLPAGGDQDTYDKIFRSIRDNLLIINGK